ncbi:MAG: CehA/McbA family metallohydrolase [Polyangiaceae bacterium]|nr:CehA/McbA family metallohydrolase [Polyangiaceae bacterium]
MRSSLLLAAMLLVLPVSGAPRRPPGTVPISVRVLDEDSGGPLPVRIHIAPAGAGRKGRPLSEDTIDGRWSPRLPRGRYLITAHRGPEYTMDRLEFTADIGAPSVELRLRRVVDPGPWVAADLHVHSSRSFDSRVTPEQRLRSLAAAGIRFAAPVEHNTTGGFPRESAAQLGVSWVPAVEVTPAPAMGHFSVFPYEGDPPLSMAQGADRGLLALLRRRNPDALIQINHPRLSGGMGFFNVIRLDVRRGKNMELLPTQADTIEVLNGIDLQRAGQAERLLTEWMELFERGHRYWATGGSDVHHAEQVPGYPRTYVRAQEGEEGLAGLTRALRRGRALVTTGPLLELRQGDRWPGDTIEVEGDRATVQLRLQAAPWVDVRRIELWAGGKRLWSKELAARPLVAGPPGGEKEQARREAQLFEGSVTVEVPTGARGLIAVARGDAPLGRTGVLRPFPSLAFTNPLLLPQPPR